MKVVSQNVLGFVIGNPYSSRYKQTVSDSVEPPHSPQSMSKDVLCCRCRGVSILWYDGIPSQGNQLVRWRCWTHNGKILKHCHVQFVFRFSLQDTELSSSTYCCRAGYYFQAHTVSSLYWSYLSELVAQICGHWSDSWRWNATLEICILLGSGYFETRVPWTNWKVLAMVELFSWRERFELFNNPSLCFTNYTLETIVQNCFFFLQFVTRAVRVIDLVTNIDMQAFQNHAGLSSIINRLSVSQKSKTINVVSVLEIQLSCKAWWNITTTQKWSNKVNFILKEKRELICVYTCIHIHFFCFYWHTSDVNNWIQFLFLGGENFLTSHH